MPDQPLASLSLTHVHYDPTDNISYLAAWASLLPQGLCIVYITLIYSTREVEIALTFAGQLACEALNWALKRYIKEERPRQMNGKGYGMPSSHAQFASFFAVSVGLFLMLRHSPTLSGKAHRLVSAKGSLHANGRSGQQGVSDGDERNLEDIPGSDVYRLQLHNPRLTHALQALSVFVTAGTVAASRVYLNYHTPKQVIVGCVVGTLFAMGWFGVTECARRLGLVDWVLELDIMRKARIRDLICEEDVIEIGWRAEMNRRRQRTQKALAKQATSPQASSINKKKR